jgi:hypothetical protein
VREHKNNIIDKTVRHRVIAALPIGGDDVVLRKQRVVDAFPLMGDAPELAEHGFHYSTEGLVADMLLIDSLRSLLKALKVDAIKVDLNTLDPKERVLSYHTAIRFIQSLQYCICSLVFDRKL